MRAMSGGLGGSRSWTALDDAGVLDGPAEIAEGAEASIPASSQMTTSVADTAERGAQDGVEPAELDAAQRRHRGRRPSASPIRRRRPPATPKHRERG